MGWKRTVLIQHFSWALIFVYFFMGVLIPYFEKNSHPYKGRQRIIKWPPICSSPSSSHFQLMASLVSSVVQLPSHVRLFATCGLQHARPPCPSPSPGVCPSLCSLHQWCHPTISSSDALFPLCPWSFPLSGTFPVSHLGLNPNFWCAGKKFQDFRSLGSPSTDKERVVTYFPPQIAGLWRVFLDD